MKSLTANEVVLTASLYTGLLLLTWLITWSKALNPVWAIFSASGIRLMSLIILAAISASITLYYNDWIAYFAVPLIFLAAVLLPFIDHGKSSNITAWTTMLITTMLILFVVPIALTTWYREELTGEIAAAVGAMLVSFWLGGAILTAVLPAFGKHARPFARTRSLVLLLTLTFYSMWFCAKKYNVMAVSVIAALAICFWLANGNNKVLSVSLRIYQESHYQTALVVFTLAFAVALNLSISIAKGTNKVDKTVYLYNITMVSVSIAVFLSIITLALLQRWKLMADRLVAENRNSLKSLTDEHPNSKGAPLQSPIYS